MRERPDVAALALEHWVGPLAGRPVFLTIGNADGRVGTAQCLGLAASIVAHESAAGLASSQLEMHVVVADGHGLPEEWYAAAARFLLPFVSGGMAGSTAPDQ